MASQNESKICQTTGFKSKNTVFEWRLKDCKLVFSKTVIRSQDWILTHTKRQCSAFLRIDGSFFETCSSADTRKSILEISIGPGMPIALVVKIIIANNNFPIRQRKVELDNEKGKELEFSLPSSKYEPHVCKGSCMSSLESSVTNDTLTISCEVQEIYGISEIEKPLLKSNGKVRFTTDMFTRLYNDKRMFDVTFIIGKDRNLLKAHSVVLAAVYPYFLTLFDNSSDTKMQTEQIFDLTNDPDITIDGFRSFLDYVYGVKTIDDLENMAPELLFLASIHKDETLRENCESILCKTLDKTNVVSRLLLANKCNSNLLKKQVLAFLKSNKDAVKNSDEFKEICSDPDLMSELFFNVML